MHARPDTGHPDRLIARLAEAQHNVVGRGQLVALGLGRGAIAHRVRVGRLHRVLPGVYAVGHGRLSREGRWMAATLLHGDGALLSHRSAAALWGVWRRPAATEITVPGHGGRWPQHGVIVHRSIVLTSDDRTRLDGIPVTTPARMLLDVAAVRPRDAPRLVEEVEKLRLFDLAEVERVLLLNHGGPGTRALRNAIVAWTDPAFVRSDLERRFLRLCRRERLPAPAVNVAVGGWEVDFLWHEQRLVVETDGRESHGTRAAFERDRARDAELVARGFRVVRFTYRQVRWEAATVARVLRRLLPVDGR